MDTHALKSMWQELGVDSSKPGFYDDPNFVAKERVDSSFLDYYARHIEAMEFTEEYLEFARKRILQLSAFVYNELERDGRLGACMDVSQVLTRILEKEGIWCYMASGGLRVDFAPEAKRPSKYFWPHVHPDNPTKTGHAWVCAPPFKVVDITLKCQPYAGNQADMLPDFVCEEKPGKSGVTIDDLAEPELRELFRYHYHRPMELSDIEASHPGALARLEHFGISAIQAGAVRLTYFPLCIHASDGRLEEISCVTFSGKYPMELYEAFLKEQPE